MPTASAELVKETITISAVGKFGPKVGDIWYGVNKPLTLADFQVGGTYQVLVKVSGPSEKNPAGGKRYIAQIIGDGKVAQAPTGNDLSPVQNNIPVTLTSGATTIPQGNKMTYTTPKPRDFDAEARGKTRCVQFQSALESPSLAGLQLDTTAKIIAAAKELADAGVEYTFSK